MRVSECTYTAITVNIIRTKGGHPNWTENTFFSRFRQQMTLSEMRIRILQPENMSKAFIVVAVRSRTPRSPPHPQSDRRLRSSRVLAISTPTRINSINRQTGGIYRFLYFDLFIIFIVFPPLVSNVRGAWRSY